MNPSEPSRTIGGCILLVMMPRRRNGFVVLALLGALGCSPAEPLQAEASALPPILETEAEASATNSAGAAPPRFKLQADSTPRLELLSSLAESEGFSLAGPTEGLGRATANIEAGTVEAVLAALLHDVPFSLHYRAAGEGTQVRLTELELWPSLADVGGVAEEAAAVDVAEARRSAAGTLAAQVSRGREASAREIRERFDAQREREALARETALIDLDSEDADVRFAAVPHLEVDRPADARRLAHLALDDPDPRIRLEAVEQLGFGDPAAAIPILREATRDPNEPVATTAKNELEHALAQLAAD